MDVFSQIYESASVLGLSRDHAVVKEAEKIATVAIEQGYSDEIAVEFGRSELIRGSAEANAA